MSTKKLEAVKKVTIYAIAALVAIGVGVGAGVLTYNAEVNEKEKSKEEYAQKKEWREFSSHCAGVVYLTYSNLEYCDLINPKTKVKEGTFDLKIQTAYDEWGMEVKEFDLLVYDNQVGKYPVVYVYDKSKKEVVNNFFRHTADKLRGDDYYEVVQLYLAHPKGPRARVIERGRTKYTLILDPSVVK